MAAPLHSERLRALIVEVTILCPDGCVPLIEIREVNDNFGGHIHPVI